MHPVLVIFALGSVVGFFVLLAALVVGARRDAETVRGHPEWHDREQLRALGCSKVTLVDFVPPSARSA